MTDADLRLLLAGTRLVAWWEGPEAVQMLREEIPVLFVELDRLDKEYPLGTIEPARTGGNGRSTTRLETTSQPRGTIARSKYLDA